MPRKTIDLSPISPPSWRIDITLYRDLFDSCAVLFCVGLNCGDLCLVSPSLGLNIGQVPLALFWLVENWSRDAIDGLWLV